MKRVDSVSVEELRKIAETAYRNVIRNYWKVTDSYSCFHNKYKEGRDSLSELMWNFSMMLLALETYYDASGDISVRNYVYDQMMTYYKHKSKEFLLSTGKDNNPACDDAAWTAMGFMLSHRLLGDNMALEYCHDMIKRAYDYWQDGATENGLWYCYPRDNDGHIQVKSIYCAGLILTELEYYEITKGTDKQDEVLHQRTLALYNWIEKNLRRDGEKEWNGQKFMFNDALYFCDFIDDKSSGAFYPRQYNETENIYPTQSWTSLFGNMAMSVINYRLFKMYGEADYLNKAVSTANALVNTKLNNNGCLLNDRDAWTNTAFLGFFVREILPLEGVDEELERMIVRTATQILAHTCYEGGFYGSDWDGSGVWLKDDSCGEHTKWICANATTVHVLFAAYAAEKKKYEAGS